MKDRVQDEFVNVRKSIYEGVLRRVSYWKENVLGGWK